MRDELGQVGRPDNAMNGGARNCPYQERSASDHLEVMRGACIQSALQVTLLPSEV